MINIDLNIEKNALWIHCRLTISFTFNNIYNLISTCTLFEQSIIASYCLHSSLKYTIYYDLSLHTIHVFNLNLVFIWSLCQMRSCKLLKILVLIFLGNTEDTVAPVHSMSEFKIFFPSCLLLSQLSMPANLRPHIPGVQVSTEISKYSPKLVLILNF